jgi:hypothetical protein
MDVRGCIGQQTPEFSGAIRQRLAIPSKPVGVAAR